MLEDQVLAGQSKPQPCVHLVADAAHDAVEIERVFIHLRIWQEVVVHRKQREGRPRNLGMPKACITLLLGAVAVLKGSHKGIETGKFRRSHSELIFWPAA